LNKKEGEAIMRRKKGSWGSLMSAILGKGSLTATVLAALIALSNTAQAAQFCVATTDQLMAALYDAETNQENDVIKIVKGTYVGNFSYQGEANQALTIGGGYIPGCSSQTRGPGQTILDGAQLDKLLYILINSSKRNYTNCVAINKYLGASCKTFSEL
jgi:hypothetical protein